ncbi:MAG: histidine phosphatase family protein [Bradymonadales bacterium]|jgi:probable phosphoglycerate mutase
MRLYLCRHAKTLWNAERRVQGLNDIALSEEGRRQAEALAERIFAQNLENPLILSSPLQRALDTAKAVQARCAFELRVEPRLIEIDTGVFTGKSMMELNSDPLWQTHLADPYHTGYAQAAEPLSAVDARVSELLLEHAATERDIIWVTHAGLIRLAMMQLLGIPKSGLYRIGVENAAMTMFKLGASLKFCFHNV